MDDITAAHEQGEQALRHLTVIAERAREGIVVVDLNGALQYVNTAWATMHGYEAGHELIGKHISIFHTKEQMKTDVIPFMEETKSRGQLAGPVEHVRRDGTPLPTEMLMVVFKDGEGKAAGLICFATDLTEHERTKDELKRYRNHLAELVKQQTAELTATNEQLQNQIAAHEPIQNKLQEHRNQLEQRLTQQTTELTAANEQLQNQIAEHEQAEQRLKQQTAELTAANEQLQKQIAEHEQAEEHLKQQTNELTAANEQLQNQIAAHEPIQNELQEYRDQLEQHLTQQSDELKATNKRLQHEISKRKQAEERLGLLQTKLDNINSIIEKYL